MSKYVERIQEILRNAKSKKITDKKRSVAELLELYNNKDALHEIDKNSEQNVQNVANWSFIIHIAHQLLLSEADRLATKDKFNKAAVNERQNTCILLKQTVQHANSYKVPLIKCRDIMPMVLQILDSRVYDCYHDTYLFILVTYILPFRLYQVKMSSEEWIELLKICKNLYSSGSSHINKSNVLNALEMITKYGCLHSDLVLHVKKMLPFLETICLDVRDNQDLLSESAFKLINTVCQQIASESRIALCQFGETVLPNVMCLNNCTEKYKLLLFFVQIHHPKGTSTVQDGAYASDWEKWNSILKSIYLMIFNDAKVDILPKCFVQLATEVFKQVFERADFFMEMDVKSLSGNDGPQAVKRRRMSIKMHGPVDVIANTNTKEAWPMIQMLIGLLEKYPECLKSQDLGSFLEIIVELLTQFYKEEVMTDSLYKLVAVLLKKEKVFSPMDTQNCKMYWDKIWDILIRSLNMNQNERSSHTLLQLFIMNKKIMNPNGLLRLYLTNVIKWSTMSIRTLIVFCKYLPLPTEISMFNINICSPMINSNSVRLHLLKWTLNIPWQKLPRRLSVDELSVLAVSITLKSKYEKELNFNTNDFSNICDCSQNEENSITTVESLKQIEDCYLKLACKANLLFEEEKHDHHYVRSNDNTLFTQDLLTYLIDNLCDINTENTGSDDLCALIIKISVIAKVATIVKQLNMISGNINESLLITTMKTYLNTAYTLLADIDPSRKKFVYLLNVTKVLCGLYSTSYDADIARIIVSSSTLKMLQNLFHLMNIEDSEIIDYTESSDYYNDWSDSQNRHKRPGRDDVSKKRCNFCHNGIIRTHVTKILTLFCCMDVGQEKYEIQIKLMKRLLTVDMYDLSRTVDLKMAMIVLESMTKYGKEQLRKHHEETPIQFLSGLSKQCKKDETAIGHILNVLPYCFEYVLEYNYTLNDLISIISEYYNRITETEYGFAVHIKFLKCVLKIAQIDPSSFLCTSSDVLNQSIPIVESILSSLNSPLCIIRLQAIQCIEEIYSLKNLDFKWKEAFFAQIEEYTKKLFAVDRQLEDNEKFDENKTRIASAVLVLAAICADGPLQCHALLAILKLAVDKQFNIQIIPKALKTIEKKISYTDLIEDNLSYLLSYWYNSKYSSKPFLWSLTQCESEAQFHKKYINMMVSIKFQNLSISDTITFCKRVDLKFEEVIENIFPQILSWLLYCICEKPEHIAVHLANKVFHKLLSNQEEFVGVKKFTDLFNDKFEETLIYLIQRLHDEDHFEQILGLRTSFPKSDPPHFKKKTIDTCLSYMEKNFFWKKNTLQYILASSRSNTLQKVLLHLTSNIYRKQSLEHKLKAFHQYVYFSTLIIQDLNEDHFKSLSTYVIKDIGTTLLHIIQINNETLSKLSCKYFYIFVKHVLPTRSKEVEEILSFTVMTLIPIVQIGKIPEAIKILKFLIIDQKEILQDAIGKLNSFPNTLSFQEIRNVHNGLKYKMEKTYNLKEEIQHFLNTLVDKNIHCSVEDILHLRMQLSTRKEELQDLYNKLDILRGFAEDCASSMLHRLIYKLVKLTMSSNMEVSMEAAKCLGELGPVDLATMILYLEKSYVKETSDLIEILTLKIVKLLIDYVFHSDVELRKASANVLYTVFSSPWGQKLLEKSYMEHLKHVLNDSQAMLSLNYIQPFIVSKKCGTTRISICKPNTYSIMDPNNTCWTIKSDSPYSDWIIEITCNIAKCFTGFYSKNLIPLCTLSSEFCELILPRLIFLIIHLDEKLINLVCSCINQFFEYHFNCTSELDSSMCSTRKTTNCDHQIVHCMLDIVNYIRIQITDVKSLNLNYMYIAKAAQYCSAFFTAILYAEISCQNIVSDNHDTLNIQKIDHMCEFEPEKGKIIQNILRDTYLKIGDPDAIYGTGSSHLQDHSMRIQHYIHTRKWDKVILAQDVELFSGNMTAIREMASGLHQSGLQFLLGQFISAISKGDEKVDEDIQYECAWRLSNWNLCEGNYTLQEQGNCNLKSEIAETNYDYCHYQALKYFHENNDVAVQIAIESARLNIIKGLRNISLESSKTVYKKLMQLQLIREIEELCFAKQDEYINILHKWEHQDIANSNEFQYVEPILTQRTVMYQIKNALRCDLNIKRALATTYLGIAKTAADQENLHVAARSLALLAKQPDLPSSIQDQLLYQESLLAWHKKDLEIGRFLLRTLLYKRTVDPSIHAQALRVYGDWMAETKSENPQAVIKKYYLESINTSISIRDKTVSDTKNLHDTRLALARFADTQFEQISSYIKSPQFEALKECVAYSGTGISIEPTSKDVDVRRAAIINLRQNTNDVAELQHIENEKNNYLILALRYYLEALQQSDDYNFLIFRVVALWLDNRYHEEVNELLRVNLDKIPSFKFVPLVPQLAAHMSNTTDEFSSKVNKIMERCALEHPHHTLPVLLALKNLYGDHEYNPGNKSKPVEEPRVQGARKLLEGLLKSPVKSIVSEMDKLSQSLVMLANLKTSSSKSGSAIDIPKSQKILKIKNFNNVLVSTLTIHVKSSRNYTDIIGIAKYVEAYQTVGGLNAPKKLICIGSDGIRRPQLVKGKDDLRQDAVMQQVFNVMNILLKACKDTKRRKLMIRTYKVVPLTQRSGILEWCDNTTPIVGILVGSNSAPGLHKKYYPKDYTANICKEKIAGVSRASNDAKLKVFMDCCAHMHPALHHFFTEKYPSPETWFERRLAYTRSVATTSMAGYILGLGDRHLSNILIDQKTAEVIHIDFGIAFEQGKVLPIPETVPFRLTRNIEAAMGVSGIEGTMRRCCEKTLAVLRDQRQIIITLLQVLIYDPLFTWAITPAKAHNIQSDCSSRTAEINQSYTGVNKTAERSLLRIEQKLQGTEEGLASSIPGQVERLIQQARDPTNLCRLYHGWQPYL